MKKHGLGFLQMVTEEGLSTTIFHIESGEEVTSTAPIPQDVQLKGMNDFQVLGSAITYMRRYSLSSMLGLVTDKDTGAVGEQVKQPTPKQQKKPVNKKQEITDERFAGALKAIQDGTYSKEDFLKKFKLTKEQTEKYTVFIKNLEQ